MGKSRRKGVRLEMTSLMDVMFLVLVFFIYCIFDMTMLKGTKVDLPQAAGAPEKGEHVVITVLPDDSLQLNGKPLPRAEIVRRMTDLVRVKMLPPVLVAGDRRASLGAGVELMSELKAAGVEKISFQVRDGE